MMSESCVSTSPAAERITRFFVTAVGIYSFVLVVALNAVILSSGATRDRAIIAMADGLIVCWIVGGGTLTVVLRKRLVPLLVAIPIDWRVRFVALCMAMASLEEAIAVTMTNLAPLLGWTPAEAHITASTNYLKVVCFHSVVVFVPMFIAWAWMLNRWRFSPLQVLLLFGITGSIAEASINPMNLIGGFWVFVYGLMVYLPAHTVPADRRAQVPRWWCYPLAVVLPMAAAIPVVPAVMWARRWLGVELFPGS